MVHSADVKTPGRPRAACAIAVALCLAAVAATSVGGQTIMSRPPGKVDQALYRELRQQGVSCVCVELRHSGSGRESLEERRRLYHHVQQEFLATLPDDGSIEVRHRYEFSPVLVLSVESVAALAYLESSGLVRRALCDVKGQGGLAESRQVIGADLVHELGILGEGQVIAVLDSGIDSDHPDFEGAILRQHHFLEQGEDTGVGAEDDNGHGTHVTGIIASRGVVAPVGIAPASRIIAVKVLDRNRAGWFSDWAAGVEHIVLLHLEDNGIEVGAINMSLVSHDKFGDVCDEEAPALSLAIEAARQAGINVFACAGNSGRPNALSLPGCYSTTVSVGSVRVDDPDQLSSFTDRGPLLDLLAPGESITSTGRGGDSSTRTGCSAATPHVSAIAALIREVDPAIDPDTVDELLRGTATPVFDEVSGLTYGRVDARAAVRAASDPPTEFHRGDANGDGRLDLVDPVFALKYLFSGTETPECFAAADANDDDRLDLADPLYLLQYVALGGPAPPPPGPPGLECGVDEAGQLGCARYEACQ